MKCPECDEEMDIDYTPEMNHIKPYEIACYGCGSFKILRYATMEEAEKAMVQP